MINQQRILYITILAIILIVLFYYNKSVITEGLDVLGGGAPEPSETDAYVENKETTGNMTKLTGNSKLDDIASQIKECQVIINDINEVLPRGIEDISIGTVNQTENLEQVGFTIEQKTTQTLNPVTGENESTGAWEINAVLPRGKQGPPGIRGPKGNPGSHGETGETGPQGRQGPWGKDCSNNKCN